MLLFCFAVFCSVRRLWAEAAAGWFAGNGTAYHAHGAPWECAFTNPSALCVVRRRVAEAEEVGTAEHELLCSDAGSVRRITFVGRFCVVLCAEPFECISFDAYVLCAVFMCCVQS